MEVRIHTLRFGMFSHLSLVSRAMVSARATRNTLAVLRARSSERAPSAQTLIARELRQNAALLGEAEDWYRAHVGILEPEQRWFLDAAQGWRAVRPRVSVCCWTKRRVELHKLRKKAPRLWEEVARAYDELTDYRESYVPKVTKVGLESLAGKLDEAKI